LANSALGQSFLLSTDELARWKQTVLNDRPRLYHSERHADARMHLGGLGTGNFEIGVDGQFTRWQLFNTLRDGTVPLHFAVKAGQVARLLQTSGGPDWPRINAIEMTGEYPFAQLRFMDERLPVQIELKAFTPFAPLDVALSSLPVAAFIFRIQNRSAEPQKVSLGAFMQNPIGYDAAGDNQWAEAAHPAFGANLNEPVQEGQAAGLLFRAQAARGARLDKPVLILAGTNLQGLRSPPQDRPDQLDVRVVEQMPNLADFPAPGPTHAVIWLEDAAADSTAAFLGGAVALARAGATLLFSGRSMPLLCAYASATRGQPLAQASRRPDILFEDFENGYGSWTIEGDAFGREPAHGTLPNQQQVSGFEGKGLVNSYLNGDDSTGRLTSKPFPIERHFIHFLIGGGHHAQTQIRLLVGGKVVRTTSGKDNERLEPASWEVREFEGQTGQLAIVDEQKGGWGHINIDQISFSDQAGNGAVLALLDEILPARFSDVTAGPDTAEGLAQVQLAGRVLKPGTQQARAGNGLDLLVSPLGKGKVVLACGQFLEPAHAEWPVPRQPAYAAVCALAGARFEFSHGQSSKAPGFGTLALAALGGSCSVLNSFLDWSKAWEQFASQGQFSNTSGMQSSAPTPAGRTANGAVARTVTLQPGEEAEVPFLIAWHYPNKYNSDGVWMGCHYTALRTDAQAVLKEAVAQFDDARRRTEQFRQALYDSSLPYWLLDCLTANAAIFRHIGVVFRIANADVFGWEGSNGCCQPTCTHVWGYEQTFARLFPELEREMRRIDFKHQQRPDGGVNNRTDVPSPLRPTGEQPFADGHASCVLKAYREALNSVDDSFFREYWPHARRAVEYLVARDAKSHGGQPAGYLEDDQWNTYDEALHGVTTFISGYYLAALRAGEEWARRMGDTDQADRWQTLFNMGQQKLVDLCWNGDYFQQHLPGYETRAGEVGPGCMADQLIGQWWAHQLGLGYILPREKIQTALRSVFNFNFKTDLTGWKHLPRAFAGAKDKGLIICTWPRGGRPPQVMLYSDEVWTGIEYQVAAHLIYEGFVDEGMTIAKAARDRYDGIPRAPMPRNPWDEIECGGHYARAMSSWSLLLALSGWMYDGPRQALQFSPRHRPSRFKSFWSGPAGWGTIAQSAEGGRQLITINVSAGELALRQLQTQPSEGQRPLSRAEVVLAGQALPSRFRFADGQVEIVLTTPALVKAGERLEIALMA
jgi:uncharacterized protein (DUF608 family)